MVSKHVTYFLLISNTISLKPCAAQLSDSRVQILTRILGNLMELIALDTNRLIRKEMKSLMLMA